ncbi:hypothetical protein B5E77_01650 [Lachnoclostridium sp. An131]|uniref:M56 family metallopeptidase n=1 Tax=Lachnoclostridium sp. An131 TaxID=1965555 RepID=UPI000B5857F4|nr:M56 family metallopeptidase [Lachnoclostridium sp. An131]OUQ28487.1 hypothetical protein B5E77_01650 [Lachnoclostridium sp. An131]
MSLIQMSFSGAVMILVIFAVRTAAINGLPKKLFILLWELVLLRLLVPFSIPSVISVYTFLERGLDAGNSPAQALQVPAAYLIPQAAVEGTGGSSGAQLLQESVPGTPEAPVWLILWLVGASACAIFFLVSYLRCYREFRTSLPVHSEMAVRWLKRHPLRRTVRVRQSDRISAPLTYGVLKPVILLPKEMDLTESRQLEYILLHEYIHIRRLDSVRKMVMVSALCVHWFNPFVWLMYILFNRDMELACDESVVRKSGTTSRRDYAKTLISMEEKKSMALPLCNSFSQNAVRERITAIMKTKKVTIGIGIVCVLILAVVIILFATSADGGQETAGPEETELAGDAAEGSGEEADTVDGNAGQDAEQGDETASDDTVSMDAATGRYRESTTVLQCTVEGEPEEMPATLYVGDRFSMYIPDEGWQIYDQNPVESEKMSAVYLPGEGQVGLWVEYHQEGVADTGVRLMEEGYSTATDTDRVQRQDGEILTEARIFGDGNESWLVCTRRPATSEGAEGIAARLDAIADTFEAATEQGRPANLVKVLGTDSAEMAVLEELMKEFYTDYFNGDEEGIRQYLSVDFSGTPEVYDAPETAGELEIREIKSLVDMTESEDNSFEQYSQSVEFVAPGEDSFTYLSVEFVKENGEWKVSSYGLEK